MVHKTALMITCLIFKKSAAFLSNPSIHLFKRATFPVYLQNTLDDHINRWCNQPRDVFRSQFQIQKLSLFSSYSSSLGNSDGTTTSSAYALDPYSKKAQQITTCLGLTPTQHSQLVNLAELVVDWNDRINLISRKDCNAAVVFGRHILPSIALKTLLEPDDKSTVDDNDNHESIRKIVDIGTGGGFPGLPLAVVFPQHEFMLVDSVGKKIKVVEAMAEELGLGNVQTHNGRAEEIEIASDDEKFDTVLGRSVTALPKFCFWIQNLLKSSSKNDGKLVYIIGGEVEDIVVKRCIVDIPLNKLIQSKLDFDEFEDGQESISDKRALVLKAKEVKIIAAESGEKDRPQNKRKSTNSKKIKSQRKNKFEQAKGAWSKRDNAVPKERGYENFKRYSS